MDKIVYVTGGANGIGKAIVTLFCKDGADVTFCDIDTVAGEKLSNELSSYKCTYHEVDLSDARVLEQSVNKVIEAKGNIDVIINNAGVSHFNSMLDITVEDFDKVMDINLRPIFITARTLAKHRDAHPQLNRYGRIINMASTRHLMSEPNSEAYAASKGAIVSLTHALALSLSKYHVTVNCISPGWIETGSYDLLTEQDHTQHPSGRVGKPEDIARACLFLCQPENDFINGQNIVIDGGMTKKMIYC
ncbi:putative oxidoreductase PA3106 [Petrimonas mucosa]|uniref:Putative oxidoreductase PA3106 n=2 Tax=Petrimonas mucosa TaxID=1642646 RepID=A0A1G4G3Q2_9BACT|nr:putative oxidoreductase PA3106 [Petrimonas mucosa]SFU56576.1 hypothetical protein SAMN05216364_102624 [Porphyromonadaceae bacterium KHP3R9]